MVRDRPDTTSRRWGPSEIDSGELMPLTGIKSELPE